MDDTFWEDMVIPFQEEDEEFQFANPVVVSQQFVKAIGTASYLGKQAEILTEQIGNLKVTLDRFKRERDKLRRRILANHYKEITKSASSEIQDAFIYKMAQEDGLSKELLEIEAEIEDLTREIEVREPRVDQYKTRLRLLETSMNWGKQYLDFDKLIIRSTNYSN